MRRRIGVSLCLLPMRLARFLALDALLVWLLLAVTGCSATEALSSAPPNVAGVQGAVTSDALADVEARLDEALAAAGPVTVVATVDHRANAASVGLDLPSTRVVFFGNPRLGTPLLQADPRVGLDLPQRILTTTTSAGTVVATTAPAFLRQRYGLGALPALDRIEAALDGLARVAAGDGAGVSPFASPLATAEGDGLVRVVSTSDAASTRARLRAAIQGNDALRIVFELDHAANAASVGLDLGPATVFVFGTPALGTPLMQAQRTAALDLPQKMLVYTDASGETAVLYNDAAYLARRHGITRQADRVDTVSDALDGLAAVAAGR